MASPLIVWKCELSGLIQFAGEEAGLYIGSFFISIKIVPLDIWNCDEEVSTKIGIPVVDDAGDTGERGEESILKEKFFMFGWPEIKLALILSINQEVFYLNRLK